jgi:hypothetical protein
MFEKMINPKLFPPVEEWPRVVEPQRPEQPGLQDGMEFIVILSS